MNNYTAPDIWFPNLGISFENVPRVFITVFGFEIFWYAIFIVLGILSAYLLAVWYAKRTGQKPNDYTDLLIVGVILAFIGLRLYYMVFTWDSEQGGNFILEFLNFRGGGLAIYGGIIGALVAGIIVSAKKNIPFTTFTDTCAPSLLLGQIIGRFGNFFNREAFGGPTDGLFAMRIRVDQSFMRTQELLDSAVYARGVQYFQVHPTFLYEQFFNLLLMIFLLVYRPHKKFAGEIILLYMLGYGIIRFFLEGLRTDQLPFFGTGLAASQVMSVVFVVVAAGLLLAGHMYKPTKVEKSKSRSKK